MTSRTTNKFSPEVRDRAMWMVLEHEGEHASRWEAMSSIAGKNSQIEIINGRERRRRRVEEKLRDLAETCEPGVRAVAARDDDFPSRYR